MALEISLVEFEQKILAEYGTNVLKRGKINDLAKKYNLRVPKQVWENRTSEKRGCTYLVSETRTVQSSEVEKVETLTKQLAEKPEEKVVGFQAIRNTEEQYFIKKDPNFIRWGSFSDLRAVIKSKKFFPVFVTGLSGNGKTTSIEQACAIENREAIRVNFTRETSEADLIGSLALVSAEYAELTMPKKLFEKCERFN